MTEEQRLRLNAVPMAATQADNAKYFEKCLGCGEWVDQRKLGDVLHHDSEGHKPIVIQQ